LAVILIVPGPTVWVDTLKNSTAIFPLKNPALFSMPAAFLVSIIVSAISSEPGAVAKFQEKTPDVPRHRRRMLPHNCREDITKYHSTPTVKLS
jgi:Na+(H+)/acetate symporter ActP